MSQQLNNLPPYEIPFMQQGINAATWYRFVVNLFNGLAPAAEFPVVGTGSPFTYTAPRGGFMILTGGTVSAVEFSRDGVTFYSYGTTAGTFPLSSSDRIRITYTVVPVMTFVPT